MEIKVLCACGTKYKFDVEPVNERMPWPVNCPSCGADGTARANEIIRQTVAAPPPATAAPVFVAAPAVPAAQPPASLRINRPASASAPPPIAAPPPLASSGTPPPPRTFARPQPAPSGTSGAKKALVGGLTFLVVAVVTFKIIRLIGGGIHLAEAIKEVSDASSDASTRQWNLSADNQVILYVKHTNSSEIAQACVSYWKDNLHRVLRILPPEKEAGDPGEYEVLPQLNGYILVVGSISDWKDPQYEGAAQFLSQKFNTMVFEEKDVDFSGAFVFGVFDQGTNLFHARLNVSAGDEKDTVTVVHPEWAIANGYKPGKDGFDGFDIRNADDLTKKFGMNLWDKGGHAETNFFILLKDPVAARATSE